MARSFALLAVLAAAAFAAPALAQTPQPQQTPVPGTTPVIAPDEIRYCLCAHQGVETLGARVAAATARHKALEERITALDKQLVDSKATVDVNQPDQVDAYRRLVEAREQAAAELYNDATPQLQQSVAQYNARTESYNAFCTTRSIDEAALDAVKASLSCPAEP